jgi:hypothetical protein
MSMEIFKNSERIIRIILTGILLLLLSMPYMIKVSDLPVPECLFKSITNLSCPTCGISRAFFLTAEGSIYQAMKQNFVGIFLYLGILFLLLKYILEFFRNRKINLNLPQAGSRLFLFLFFGGWFSFWFIRLLRESL